MASSVESSNAVLTFDFSHGFWGFLGFSFLFLFFRYPFPHNTALLGSDSPPHISDSSQPTAQRIGSFSHSLILSLSHSPLLPLLPLLPCLTPPGLSPPLAFSRQKQIQVQHTLSFLSSSPPGSPVSVQSKFFPPFRNRGFMHASLRFFPSKTSNTPRHNILYPTPANAAGILLPPKSP